MDISDSRRVAYGLHDSLMDACSRGMLVDHRFSDMRRYTSWPDSETILMSVNAAQDTDRLREFIHRFDNELYTYNNVPGMKIRGMKISYPHKRFSSDIVPPHPSMSDKDLLQYEWPNTQVTDSYTAVLYIDIGAENREYIETEEGEFSGVAIESERWVRLMNWPICIGSNRCNMTVIRSYIDDPIYGERARYILEELTKCEFTLPDGYFIIKGRIKKVNIIDRLQMNYPYIIQLGSSKKSDKSIVGNLICEIRSLERDIGISTHNIHLISSVDSREIPVYVDKDIYKMWTAIAIMVLERDSKAKYNIYDIVAGAGAEMENMDIKASHSILTDAIRYMCRNDSDVMRVVSLTYNKRKDFRSIEDAKRFANTVIAPITSHRMVIDTLLPHCRTFTSKVYMIAMMTINIILSVMKRRTVSNLKDFAYKRFDIVGHRLLDYVRSMLTRSHDISNINKDMNNLTSILGQNKWPTSYKQKRRKGLSRDEDLATAIVNDAPLYNNASILDSVRMVKIGAHNSGNTSATRRVHTSQYYYQCPANTPENENIGLNNSLSEVCLVSVDLTIEERDIVESYIYDEKYSGGDILLIYDGQPLDYVRDTLYWDLMDARSNGEINQGICIAIHQLYDDIDLRVIVVRTSHGRPISPYLKLPDSMSIEEFNELGTLTWEELVERGAVVLCDPYEVTFNMEVSPWIYTSIDRVDGNTIYFKRDEFTHSAILPSDMLSQATNCISYIEHDPASRGTYATLHIKQSISAPFLFPELRFDHETASLANPEPPLISTRTARRIGMTSHPSKYIPESSRSKKGYGINVNIVFMSDFGNYDDAVHISESLVRENKLVGYYYDIFTSDQNISITASNMYNVIITKSKNIRGEMEYMEVRGVDGVGMIDPDFSDSVIVPYGHPTILEIEDIGDRIDIRDVDHRLTGHYLYEIGEGLLYTRYGFKRPITYIYRDNSNGEIVERVYEDLTLTIIPGTTRIEGPRLGKTIHVMALSCIREDKLDDYDRTFIDTDPFTWNGYRWYVSRSDMPIPRSTPTSPDRGMTVAIMKRRQIKRGDAAIKTIQRDKNDNIVGVRKEKFTATHGTIERIVRGTIVKIRVGMFIEPEPGNKYASLHAQKSVCARIIPDDQVPIARWYNPITRENEEMKIHIIFNPLALPSRMTMGMIYEQYFLGTLVYMRDKGLLDLYNDDRGEFDIVMRETYGIDNASELIDELSDSTSFVYDNVSKKERCRQLREALGIPIDGMYDMVYVREGETIPIPAKVACGSIYYVALRHLVDNKRRARGYVGKKDALTGQPVKGKARDGGAVTGTMESDVYKAHGARSMLWERFNKTSDGKIVYKCDRCGSLVSKTGHGHASIYKCIDEDAIIPVSQVTEVASVISWELYKYWLRAIGIDVQETFE